MCNSPTTEFNISSTLENCKKVGLPGCKGKGNTDCVHIRWEQCSEGLPSVSGRYSWGGTGTRDEINAENHDENNLFTLCNEWKTEIV